MNILKKIVELFLRTKKLVATVETNINKFITEHKNEIRMAMRIMETIFPAGTGMKKMRCVVVSVCSALGYENSSEEVFSYVTTKCQNIYDEFKAVIQ